MSCIYIDDSDGVWGFTRDRMVKSRKEHRCSECGRTISIGEMYEYCFGVWDRDYNVYKTCNDCLSVRKSFFGSQWIYGHIWEFIFEEYDIPLGSLDSLTPRALKRFVEGIDNQIRVDQEGRWLRTL